MSIFQIYCKFRQSEQYRLTQINPALLCVFLLTCFFDCSVMLCQCSVVRPCIESPFLLESSG